MKHFIFSIPALLIFITVFSCNPKNTNTSQNSVIDDSLSTDTNTIYVYYFHGSIRCETCVAVDENTHNDLIELFNNKVENKEIIFQSINIDKKGHEDLIKKYKIWGQTMLFIKGNKSIDKTDDAFMYVTTDPIKWKKIVEDTIYELL